MEVNQDVRDGDDATTQLLREEGRAVALEQMTKGMSLLDLPAELWVKIGQEAILTDTRPCKSCKLDWRTECRLSTIQPAITRVCKIMRAELLPYFYNTFNLRITHWRFIGDDKKWSLGRHCGNSYHTIDWEVFALWLRRIGSGNRQALGSLGVHVQVPLYRGTRQDIVEMLEWDWKVDFMMGEAVEYVGDHGYYFEDAVESYRVTFR